MAKTIRELRLKAFLTQAELAMKIGVRAETVSTWERGVVRPRMQQIRALAEAFSIEPGEIELPEAEDVKTAA
jgi:transcriptional regulator with XRE-family HTH domain